VEHFETNDRPCSQVLSTISTITGSGAGQDDVAEFSGQLECHRNGFSELSFNSGRIFEEKLETARKVLEGLSNKVTKKISSCPSPVARTARNFKVASPYIFKKDDVTRER
jgi:hypothetical protein